jgi:uncharacterized protein (DUF1330 family)
MAAYLIATIDVKDPAAYEDYKARVPVLIRKHGGEYLVRGGKTVVAEGNWKPSRIVILRFPDLAAAQNFYNDPDYEPLKALRQRASNGNIVFVEGV